MNLKELSTSLRGGEMDLGEAVGVLQTAIASFVKKSKKVNENSDLIVCVEELDSMKELLHAHKMKKSKLSENKEEVSMLSGFLCDDHFEHNKENLRLLMNTIYY